MREGIDLIPSLFYFEASKDYGAWHGMPQWDGPGVETVVVVGGAGGWSVTLVLMVTWVVWMAMRLIRILQNTTSLILIFLLFIVSHSRIANITLQ